MARTLGKDSVFGRTVQSGIAARMLEYANELLNAAYVTDPVTQNGTTWYVAKLDANGAPILKNGTAPARARSDYISVIDFMRRSITAVERASTDDVRKKEARARSARPATVGS